jgi:signal transduction histidine kinase/DNA-binding response OmpR family regulator
LRKEINYLLLFLLIFFAQSLDAKTYTIEEISPKYILTDHLEIFHDESGEMTFENIKNSSARFSPLQDWTADFLSEEIYWGKIELANHLSDGDDYVEWVLHFSLIFTDIKIYVEDKEGEIYKYQTGFFVPTHQKSFAPISKHNIVKIQIPAGETVTFYFRAENKRRFIAPKFDLTLQYSTSFFSELKKEKQQNGMYFGFVMMMLVYNFFLFIYAKDKSYLYYSIYIFGITFFSIYNSGDLADWIQAWFLYNKPQLIYIFKPFGYIAFMGYLTFVRSFLDLKTVLPKWDKFFKIFSYLTIPVIIVDYYLMWYSTFSYNIADIPSVSYAVAFLVICFSVLIPIYKTKDNKGLFIIAGFSLMGFGLLATIWMRLQSVDFTVVYFRIGTIFEIIIFSLGMAYRQKEVEEEKRKGDFELEKSKMLQDIEHQEAERLKELNNLKSRLYTNITHEFRTPLTVIMGMTENIKGHEEEKELIQRNSNNLLRLINQMLDLSKAESGSLKANLVQAEIINFLQYLAESFQSMANAKDIQLTFYTEEKEVIMDFDEQKIQHIIYNLLSNAIKYTPKKGKVVFHVKKENDKLCIKVKDSGLGIATKDQPFIFDRFYKVDQPSSVKVDGVGIGLALTKELVEFLNGEISLKSELGEGSEFVIYLPINRAEKNIIDNVNVLLEKEEPIEKEKEIALEFETELVDLDFEKNGTPQLLVIEDNEDVITYIKSCVKEVYNIEVAHDGQEGIEKAFELIPDIIISDLMMPKKNGFEVCRILKKDGKTSHIPIILLTAKATQEDKIEGLETGADAYMMKPFQKRELQIRLKKLIENRVILQAKYKGNLTSLSKNITNSKDDFFQKVINILQRELDNPNFSVAELSKEMHLSTTQMYRKLKGLTGLPPNKFIRRFRLQNSLELLQNSSMNIAEIAYQVGFSDPNYFSRAFSEEFGKPPSEVRK